MGYRSDVGIVIRRVDRSAPSVPEMLALAKTADALTDGFFELYWNDEDYGWDENTFTFYVEDVKWYDSYPAVIGVIKLYEFFEEYTRDCADEHYEGRLIRIGEESNDIEVEGFGLQSMELDEMLTVQRSVAMDGGLLGKHGVKETC